MKCVKEKKPRGEKVVEKILHATLEEIASAGVEHLSLEQVALRAGVNKTSVWRRWPTAEALVVAAFSSASDRNDVPDTGTLRGDLIEYVKRFRETCRVPGMLSLVRIRFRPEVGNDVGHRVAAQFVGWEDLCLEIFERARVRGEVGLNGDFKLAKNMLIALMTNFVVTNEAWFQGARIDAVVDLFLNGAFNPLTSSEQSES